MIKVVSHISKESYRKFIWFHLTMSFGGDGIQFFISYIILLLLSFVGVFFSFKTNGARVVLYRLPCVGYVIYLIYILLLPIISVIIISKKNPELFKTEFSITFFEDYFSETFTGPLSNGTIDNKYEILYKAFEVYDYFYLYVNQKQALIVSKIDFIQGSSEELSILLTKVLPGKKFIKVQTNMISHYRRKKQG